MIASLFLPPTDHSHLNIFPKVSSSHSCFLLREMANLRPAALLATILLCLPSSSVCARVVGMTGAMATTGGPKLGTIASPMANYCATDFSRLSYEDVTAACPPGSQGASAACCAAFNVKACQYEAQVNDFRTLCPMLFIDYLGAAGPYPAGYFVGPCVDGTKGFCVRA